MTTVKTLRIGFWNVQGLSPSKWDTVIQQFDQNKYDLIFTAETWFIDHQYHIQHPNFVISSHRFPRPIIGHEQSGLMLLASTELKSNINSAQSTSYTITLSVFGKTIFGAYFPPTLSP
ncbi:hypothetical protein BB559_006808, partial [Furculomyces boomerangus]